jgi:hypothetical protein
MNLDRQDLDNIRAIVDSVIIERLRTFKPAAAPEPEVITRAEAMALLRCNSATALSRTLADLKIKRVSAGKFRRKDIINAIARRTLA